MYVDGFNLYHRALQDGPYKWLDLGKLCTMLLPDFEIEHIYYFTARVKPRKDDPSQPQRQQAYLRALETIPGLDIHYGKFVRREKRLPLVRPKGKQRFADVWRTEEKASDVNLATQLLIDGFNQRYEAAVVVSKTTDLVAPIRAVREELGLPVGVIITQPGTAKAALP